VGGTPLFCYSGIEDAGGKKKNYALLTRSLGAELRFPPGPKVTTGTPTGNVVCVKNVQEKRTGEKKLGGSPKRPKKSRSILIYVKTILVQSRSETPGIGEVRHNGDYSGRTQTEPSRYKKIAAKPQPCLNRRMLQGGLQRTRTWELMYWTRKKSAWGFVRATVPEKGKLFGTSENKCPVNDAVF